MVVAESTFDVAFVTYLFLISKQILCLFIIQFLVYYLTRCVTIPSYQDDAYVTLQQKLVSTRAPLILLKNVFSLGKNRFWRNPKTFYNFSTTMKFSTIHNQLDQLPRVLKQPETRAKNHAKFFCPNGPNVIKSTLSTLFDNLNKKCSKVALQSFVSSNIKISNSH